MIWKRFWWEWDIRIQRVWICGRDGNYPLDNERHWIPVSAKPSSMADMFLFLFLILIFTLFYFAILYWFCHTLTWIRHGCTWVPKHEPPSHLPPHIISLDHPHAPAPSILYPASNIACMLICICLCDSQLKYL